MSLKPIVKWAGGKRQLIDELLNSMPKVYNCYYEPFTGGGALLFALTPKTAVINDINRDLYSIYVSLQNPEMYREMLELLELHEQNHNEEYFYSIRAMDRQNGFKKLSFPQRAARMIYLNKTCFNGLYRVNSKGYFNVPSNKKKTVLTHERENTKLLHDFFTTSDITILNGDFVKAVESALPGDFVYFDPPYDAFDDKASFTAYSKDSFSRDDQIRLANLFKSLSARGVKVMLSNHNTKLINELYADFNIKVVHAKRMINSQVDGRGSVEEVIITNY